MMVARSLQGAISQFAWSVGLALAVSLPPCAGVAATAWAMTGNSVGEVGWLVRARIRIRVRVRATLWAR